jgi:hypothetical protein
MKTAPIVALTMMLLAAPARAADEGALTPARPVESWYYFFSAGLGYSAYPSPLRERLYARARGGTRHQFTLDAISAYLPLRDSCTIVGLVLSGAMDLYNESQSFAMDSTEVEISYAMVGASAMRFFADKIGYGPFVRCDIGYADLIIRWGREPEIRRGGIGFLLGTGYSVALSDGERAVLSLNYAGRRVGRENYGTFGCTIGFLL